MYQVTLFILFNICLSLCSCDKTVVYTAVIYRHGDRTPVSSFPTDPWRNESYWPVKFGELTTTGMEQHYELGQWLRKRYSKLLSNTFDKNEIYVRSTDVDRTLMSAQANLAGLYPPTNKSMWNEKILWTPIPVHSIPQHDDEVLSMEKSCPTFDRELAKYFNSQAYKNMCSKYQSLMDYLTAYTGMKVKTLLDILDLYTTLNIELNNNFTLPNWTHTVFPDKMKLPAAISFTDVTATPLMARLKVGPLFKQIMGHVSKAMSNNTKALKMSMYSAHDLNIGSILNAFGLYDYHCPDFASTIIMDLIYDNKTTSYYMQISYKNSTRVTEPHVFMIPHCGKRCPVERFMKLYDNLLPNDWNYECGKQFSPILGFSIILALGLFASMYVAHKMHSYCRDYRSDRGTRINFNYSNIRQGPPTRLPATEYSSKVYNWNDLQSP